MSQDLSRDPSGTIDLLSVVVWHRTSFASRGGATCPQIHYTVVYVHSAYQYYDIDSIDIVAASHWQWIHLALSYLCLCVYEPIDFDDRLTALSPTLQQICSHIRYEVLIGHAEP